MPKGFAPAAAPFGHLRQEKQSCINLDVPETQKRALHCQDDDKPRPGSKIAHFLEAFSGALDSLGSGIDEKESFEFLTKKIPGKIKKLRKIGEPKEKKDPKQRKQRKPKKIKESKRPKIKIPKKARAIKKPKERIVFPDVLTTDIKRKYGISDVFEMKVGRDPRESVLDPRLEDVGRGGGNFVKQDEKKYHYGSWKDTYRHQGGTWQHWIWLDPSAPSSIIHPGPVFTPQPAKVLRGTCPTEVDLAANFGEDVEFIYMSPPWDCPNFGHGKIGYFTLDHLKKMDFSKVQQKGFIFMWLPFQRLGKIITIMRDHGYTFADSCGAVLSNWSGQIRAAQRNPYADKNSSDIDHLAGRMSGTCLKGVLWKKTLTQKGKERFRIGNQIIYDVFQWREKTCKFTGQLRPDHGYAYAVYQYLICQKPEASRFHALHLWCEPTLRVKNFGGVCYYPDYDKEVSTDDTSHSFQE